VNLEGFIVIFFLLTGMRRMMSWARRWWATYHNCLVTLLGRARHILPFLGVLLLMRIHA
jgi:hypothetical protein